MCRGEKMSGHGGSVKIILLALLANVGIAFSKFTGYFFSKSASLLAEAIHSVVDCTNQVLLLVGKKRSEKAPSERQPMGYGREIFFYSFIVAILLFSLGGIFAIYEGVHKISHPEPLSYSWLAMIILVIGIILESISFIACFKEVKHQNIHRGLFRWYRKTTNADLLVIFSEDLAALFGLVIALGCLVIAVITNNPVWDAIGSIIIGTLLVVMALVLLKEIKAMLVGEAPEKDYRMPIEEILIRHIAGAKIIRFIALQTGVGQVMVSYKISIPSGNALKEAISAINLVEKSVKQEFPEIKWQFVEPDISE